MGPSYSTIEKRPASPPYFSGYCLPSTPSSGTKGSSEQPSGRGFVLVWTGGTSRRDRATNVRLNRRARCCTKTGLFSPRGRPTSGTSTRERESGAVRREKTSFGELNTRSRARSAGTWESYRSQNLFSPTEAPVHVLLAYHSSLTTSRESGIVLFYWQIEFASSLHRISISRETELFGPAE